MDEQQSFGVFQGYRKNSHYGFEVFFLEGSASLSRQAIYHFQFYNGHGHPGLSGVDVNCVVDKIEITLGEKTSSMQTQEIRKWNRLYHSDLEGKLKSMLWERSRNRAPTELEFRNYLKPFEVKK